MGRPCCTRKPAGEKRAWAWGVPGLGPETWSGEPGSTRLRVVRGVSQIFRGMQYCLILGI